MRSYQNSYNVWLIHLLFSLATLFDIVVGFYIGKLLHKYFQHHRIGLSLKKRIESFSISFGKYGKIITLTVFVPLIFPLSAFLIPWFDITLTEALVYVFIGEWVFWYLPEWLLVLTTKSFVTNSQHALYVVIAVSMLITFGLKYLLKKKRKSKSL